MVGTQFRNRIRVVAYVLPETHAKLEKARGLVPQSTFIAHMIDNNINN